jgi:hypothetical protein
VIEFQRVNSLLLPPIDSSINVFTLKMHTLWSELKQLSLINYLPENFHGHAWNLEFVTIKITIRKIRNDRRFIFGYPVRNSTSARSILTGSFVVFLILLLPNPFRFTIHNHYAYRSIKWICWLSCFTLNDYQQCFISGTKFCFGRSRGSSVSIVTDYGLDDRGSIPDRGRGFLF